MKPLLIKSIPFLITAVTASSLFAQSVIPDLNFGNNGKVISNYTNDAPTISSCIALQQDGKMIIGGNTIVRVLPNGQPDISFNTTGFYFNPALNEPPVSVTVKNENITTLYADYAADTAIILKRLNADGKPDSSYGTNGTILFGLPGIKLTGYKNVLQTDDRMLLIGSATEETVTNIFVARLLQNGLPDTSFNHTGYAIIPLADGTSFAKTAAIQFNGNIILTGVYTNNNTSGVQLFAIRIKPNGTVDGTFNSTGIYFSNSTGAGTVAPNAITIQPDDKILIAGVAAEQIMVIRLKADGSADESFSSTGTLFTYIGEFNSPSGIFVRPNKKIIISAETAISAGDPSSWNYGALQLLEDGSPDNSFSGDGKMFASVSVVDHCVGAALQEDGMLVLTGYADEASLITMVGVDTAGEVDFNFGNGGIKILQLLGTNDNLMTLLERQDKKIIAVGTKNQAVLDKNNIILMLYKAGGKGLDSSFGFNGKTGIRRDNTTLLDAGLQPGGKIIACGILFDENVFAYRNAIFRFTEEGYLDYTFAPATNFLFQSAPALNIPAAKKMLVYSDDGKILFGQNNADVGSNISLTRLSADGEPDTFFGDNGIKILGVTADTYAFDNIALQHDKKILVAAKRKIDDYTTGFALLRITEAGELDNSFDEDGIKDLPFTSQSYGDDYNLCLAVQPDDKIVVASTIIFYNTATAAYDTAVTVMQLKNDGSADSSFNATGILNIFPAAGERNFVKTIAVHPDTSIYITGNHYNVLPGQTAFLMKINPAGKIDSAITNDGTGMLLIENTANSNASDLKILQDSTILSGSNLFNGSADNDFLLSAYKARAVTVYKFTGDGDWTDAGNWENNSVPPAILPAGGFVIIRPQDGGKCVLNIDQQMQLGSSIVVIAGKNLIVTGNLTIY